MPMEHKIVWNKFEKKRVSNSFELIEMLFAVGWFCELFRTLFTDDSRKYGYTRASVRNGILFLLVQVVETEEMLIDDRCPEIIFVSKAKKVKESHFKS